MRFTFVALVVHLHIYLIAAAIQPKVVTPHHAHHRHINHADGDRQQAAEADVWTDLNALEISQKAQARMKEKSFSAAAAAAAEAAATGATVRSKSVLQEADPTNKSRPEASSIENRSPSGKAARRSQKPRVRRKIYLGEVEEDEEDEDDSRWSQQRDLAEQEDGRLDIFWRLINAFSALTSWVWLGLRYASIPFQLCGQYSWAVFLAVAQATYWSLLHILRPVRIGLAPAIYVVQGFTFLLIVLPSRLLAVIAREVYPIYVYFGAAAFVGTSLGLAAAGILWAGSFVFADSASSPKLQVEQVSNKSKRSRRMDSVIARSMRENREKEARARKRGQHFKALDGKLRALENVHLEDSSSVDVDDLAGADQEDYAYRNGAAISTSSDSDLEGAADSWQRGDSKGKGPAHSRNTRRSEGGTSYTTSHMSPPTSTTHLPVGATSRGGWSAAGTSPLVSPSASLANSPVMWRSELSPRNPPETLSSYRSPSHLGTALGSELARGAAAPSSSYVGASGSKRRSGG